MPVLTAARGLITLSSELTRPDGSLSKADNVVIDADNIIEQRRGFREFGNIIPDNSLPKQLIPYKSRILRHYTNKLSYDSTGNGDFIDFAGTYVETISGLRTKYLESNGNLYFTTNVGIQKISAKTNAEFTSASDYITPAGGVKAVGLEARIKPISSGWLPAQSKVAYRLVWGTKDVNNNLIQGNPSSRVVVTNTTKDVNIGESFNINVLNYALITASQYFTFDSPTNKFFIWFNVSGTDSVPVSGDTVGRQALEVKINGLTTNSDVAAAIATTLSSVADVTLEINSNEITVTNTDGGDVFDSSQGDVAVTAVLITKLFDGQTASGTPANVELSFVIPSTITTTNYFYELYRTGFVTVSAGVTLNDIDPGEEFQKVYEFGLTDLDLANGQITVEDITPDTFREGGAFLYTNPVSGGGITQANEAPPIAQDVTLFKGSAFYANTKERHKKQFNFLSVSDFISGNSKLYVGNSSYICEYTFVGQSEITDFQVLKKEDTLGNSYVSLKSSQNERIYKIWIDKGLITHSFNATTAVTNATDTITIPNHGFANLEEVTFSGAVPTGLVSGTTYYVIKATSNIFQVSASRTVIAPIDISGVVGICTVQHTPLEPSLTDSISLRVALQTYDNTLDGTKESLIDAFFDIQDFDVEDISSDTVRVFCNNNGNTDDPTQSSFPTGWTLSVFQQGDGEDALAKEVLLSGLDSVGQAVDETARSLERVINKDPNCPVNAFYLSSVNDLPGVLLFESRTLEDNAFFIGINSSTLSDKFNPSLPSSTSISSITPTNLVTCTTPHGYVVGDEVYIHDDLSGTVNVFAGKFKVSGVPSATSFQLENLNTSISYLGLSGITYKASVVSDNAVNPNRVYFSKIFQPEAVPLVNYIDIGPKDKAIQRIVALRDSILVFKEDGIYVISGQVAPSFGVRLMDSSALILAPDAVTTLNNLVYALTSQGVVGASDTGVQVISRNIEDKINEVVNNKYNYKYVSWAMASESDRSLLVYLPTRTIDTVATQAYRYNTFTRTWTRWTKAATCGVVLLAKDKIYLGSGESSRAYVLEERKGLERQDYADRDFVRTIGSTSVNELNVTLSSVGDVSTGDVITQIQYLDINKFNRFLKKLDSDSLLTSDYYATLKALSGDNLANALLSLAVKINIDLSPYSVPTPTGINSPTAIRDDFNAIVASLNNPGSGTAFKNYKQATDLLSYESLITSVNIKTSTITLNSITPWLSGDVTIYKAIACDVEYAPQHFGRPELLKQISEGTYIFDQSNFFGGTVGYASDRSLDFTTYPFSANGPSYWNGFNWGDTVYGGLGNEVPVRTLIPQNKQVCRYLHVKFQHSNSREKWRLLGVSLEPKEISTRGYR